MNTDEIRRMISVMKTQIKYLEQQVQAISDYVVHGVQPGLDQQAVMPPDSWMVSFTQVPYDKKIPLIKLIRQYTGLGLKEAKEIADKGTTIYTNGHIGQDVVGKVYIQRGDEADMFFIAVGEMGGFVTRPSRPGRP